MIFCRQMKTALLQGTWHEHAIMCCFTDNSRFRVEAKRKLEMEPALLFLRLGGLFRVCWPLYIASKPRCRWILIRKVANMDIILLYTGLSLFQICKKAILLVFNISGIFFFSATSILEMHKRE